MITELHAPDAQHSVKHGRNIVRIPLDDSYLEGELIFPATATGVVICVGPRTECASEMIRDGGNATLRLDLLTAREQSEDMMTHAFTFAVPLLAQRFLAVTRWLAHEPATSSLGFGYFGEEMAGPAALVAAAELGVVVDAVVCRHSRPDFAANSLPRVEAATLLICSKADADGVAFNKSALQRLHCEKQLQVILPPRSFGEDSVRDCVGCALAASWFKTYVKGR